MDYFNEMNLITSVFKPLIFYETKNLTAKEVRIAVSTVRDSQGIQQEGDTISISNRCKGNYGKFLS